MKTTKIDLVQSNKRKAAIKALKVRPIANEKSVPALRERIALIEEILGLG